jgi:hypothetical protein
VTLGMESIVVEHGKGLDTFYRPGGGEPSSRGGRELAAGGV